MQFKPSIVVGALMFGAAAMAHAQVSIYGLVDVSYGKSIADDQTNRKADIHSGGDDGSNQGNSTTRVGIKGGVDVGSGVKANFKFETGGITSSGEVNPGGAFFNRQAWFGLSGGFGEVRVGRQDSVPFQTMIDYDFNGASNGVSALGYTGVGPWARGRQSRSVQYIAPTFLTGLSAQAGLVVKGNSTVPGAKDVFSAGVKYGTGPLSAAVTFQSKATSTTKDFAAIAGTWDFKVAKVVLGYADGGKVASGGSGAGPSVGATTTLAGINLGVLAAQNTDSSAKSNAVEVFVNKEIFKSTYAYGEVGNFKPKGGTSGTGFAAGIIFVF
jgi:predicted porin